MEPPALKGQYTYADYLTWNDGSRRELIDGEPLLLASPSGRHQEISGELFRQLANFLEGKKYRVYSAPLDVRLFQQEDDRPEDVQTVVQPDLLVVCDPSKIDNHGCKGAPDMIIEILSPSTQRHDRIVKLNLYQRAGVKEYWIVSPEDQTVQVLLPENGYLRPYELYIRNDIAKVHTLDGCFIELCKVFPE